MGLDGFILNRFFSNFENFNLTDIDTYFGNWLIYRYWKLSDVYWYRFYTFCQCLPIPILTNTNFTTFSEYPHPNLAQTQFKLKLGISLAYSSVYTQSSGPTNYLIFFNFWRGDLIDRSCPSVCPKFSNFSKREVSRVIYQLV